MGGPGRNQDTMPSMTNEKRAENQVIKKATIGGAAPTPRRPAAWVMPTAEPRDASEVQLDNARVAAGKVAPSPPRAGTPCAARQGASNGSRRRHLIARRTFHTEAL